MHYSPYNRTQANLNKRKLDEIPKLPLHVYIKNPKHAFVHAKMKCNMRAPRLAHYKVACEL